MERVHSKKSLQSIFNQIDSMEKSKVDVTQYAQTKDEFLPFLLIAFAALLCELLLGLLYFKQ